MKKVVSMLMAMLIIFTLCACESAMAGGSA